VGEEVISPELTAGEKPQPTGMRAWGTCVGWGGMNVWEGGTSPSCPRVPGKVKAGGKCVWVCMAVCSGRYK